VHNEFAVHNEIEGVVHNEFEPLHGVACVVKHVKPTTNKGGYRDFVSLMF